MQGKYTKQNSLSPCPLLFAATMAYSCQLCFALHRHMNCLTREGLFQTFVDRHERAFESGKGSLCCSHPIVWSMGDVAASPGSQSSKDTAARLCRAQVSEASHGHVSGLEGLNPGCILLQPSADEILARGSGAARAIIFERHCGHSEARLGMA